MNLGKKIKAQRELSNWTQQELANRLDVSCSTIGKYETNDRKPDIEMLIKLANIFDISLDELVGREYK